MELILSKYCKSLTGSLGKNYGYAIRRYGKRFFSVRTPKGPRIQDGHLRFIFTCAEMTQYNLLIADIIVRGDELLQAARECGMTLSNILPDKDYNAQEILKMKNEK